MDYRARFYDPRLGRFAQADTIVPGGVQGLDRYAYVKNSPLRFIDPSGNKACVNFNENGQCVADPDWFRKGRIPDSMPDGLLEDGFKAWKSMEQLNVLALTNGINMASSDWLSFAVATEYYGSFGPNIDWNQAMARRYRKYCSDGPYTTSCFNGFWGYIQATRNGDNENFDVWIIHPTGEAARKWIQAEHISSAIRNPSQTNPFGITSSMKDCYGYRCDWATIYPSQEIYDDILKLYKKKIRLGRFFQVKEI